ncbi:MAG: hypothetical protein LC791_04795 [Acidobacteria bacterium]|nr:hypothetical protein [Acidobacteriota bacterium]
MRSFVGSILIALVLVAGGLILLSAAERQQRLAGAERELATLHFERAANALDDMARGASSFSRLVPGLDPMGDAARVGSMSRYWQSDYDAVAGDPTLALMAANAAFRAVERDGGAWTTVVGKLDAVVKRYAEVLRNEPDNEDAAYNFELAVRRRAAVTASKQAVRPVTAFAPERTLHGRAGAPPSTSDMKQFKMIVPMLPQEREEAEQAGRGTRRIRKG